MGCINSISSILFASAEQKTKLSLMKKGKSEEQKNVIDFFCTIDGCGCGSKGSKMTLDDYKALVSNRLARLNLRQRAIDQIGLDEEDIQEIPPIVLANYVYGEDDLIRVTDGTAVSSRFSVTWLFFSLTQMYIYQYIFDMTSDNTLETTQDFFYQDITCFTTVQRVVERINLFSKGCIRKKELTAKNNYITDTLEIVVPGTSFSISMRNNERMRESLQGAKEMLRERKFSH